MFSKKLIIIFLLIIQTSCVNNLKDLGRREAELRSRETFNGYLALEYLQYSRELESKKNRRNANYFAKKGIRAARDYEVFPEIPEDWNVNKMQIEQANIAREKLIQLIYNPQVKQILPIQLAHLNLLYDCWISSEKEPKQLSEIARCKILFFKLENETNKYLDKKKTVPVAIPAPVLNRFDIYFDLNSYNFNSKTDKAFEQLLQYLEGLRGDYKILIVGNSDLLGKKLYNEALSRKRAVAVQTRLIKNGVPKEFIEVESLGSSSPEIITNQGERNKNNRLVEVYVLKGQDNLSQIPLPLIENYVYRQEILKTKKQRGI